MRVSPVVSTSLAVLFLTAAGFAAIAPVDDGAGVVTPTASPTPQDPGFITVPTPTPMPTATPTATATATATSLPADRTLVMADLEALLDDPAYASEGAVGVVVLDEAGNQVVGRNPDALLLPASTMKLVTAAAALDLHGPDGRLRSPVWTTGPISARGTLLGDVHVVAAGDPVLSTEEYRRFVYPARPSTRLDQLAAVLRDVGIEAVDGALIVDPGPFADQRRPEGWRDAYLREFDARHITGLTVDAGLDVTVHHPRSSWGDLRPEDLGKDGLTVELAADPVVHAGDALRTSLQRARLSVRGTTTVNVTPADATRIGSLESPPMSDLLTFTIKQSDNHLADTLLREIGATVTGRSTWASSASSVRSLLAERGVDLDTAVIADGSGLSRDNRISVRALASLDQVMSSSEHGRTWGALQAVAGVDGTLRSRLAGTIADGRFRGKTGTLNDVRALVGAVEGPDGRRYHVAVIANGGDVWRISDLTDQVILRLTRSLWCDPVAPADGVAVACPL